MSEEEKTLDEAVNTPTGAAEAAAGEAQGLDDSPTVAESGTEQAMKHELDQWKAKAYRAAADLDNSRKRMLRELEEARKFAIDGVLRDLFPVSDNLDRAVSAADDDNDPVVQGVKMVLNQLAEMLKRHGATSFDPKGSPFDPQFHEAMSQMPTADAEPGTVVEVFQKGWMLHDRLARPAMVIVASAPPEE
ncbi:MAG: nucleotide exchange factor GrpE [Bradymonadia bacterium]